MLDLDLLRLESLTGAINEFPAQGLPFLESGVLPRVEEKGQEISWDIKGNQRDVDTFEGKNSPAGTRALEVIGHQSARLIRTFKSTKLPGWLLTSAIRAPGSSTPEGSEAARLSREVKNLSALLDRQNEFLVARALQGAIAVTIDGLAHTIDYALPAGHEPVPSTLWSDYGADIVEDVRAWKELIVRASGRQPKRAFCSSKVMADMIKNETVEEYFAGTVAGAEFLKTGTFSAFMGLLWTAVDETYMLANGTLARYLDEDTVVICPDGDGEWGHFQVGSEMVPNDAKDSLVEQVGRSAYSDVSINPPSIDLYALENRLPIIAVPGALVAAAVI